MIDISVLLKSELLLLILGHGLLLYTRHVLTTRQKVDCFRLTMGVKGPYVSQNKFDQQFVSISNNSIVN